MSFSALVKRDPRELSYSFYTLCVCEVAQSCPTLWDSMDCSLPGSSVHGIFQARVLEWVAIFSRESSWPRDRTPVSCIAGRHFTVWATREALWGHSKKTPSVNQGAGPHQTPNLPTPWSCTHQPPELWEINHPPSLFCYNNLKGLGHSVYVWVGRPRAKMG